MTVAGDAYRVRAVADPALDAGSDTGALSAIMVAGSVVLFPERIRQEAGPRPIAVWEQRG
jgi:hypothetical protein